MRLYRTMLLDAGDGLPVVGSEKFMLGVRVPTDIKPDGDGLVQPGRRGMSVTAHDPLNMPPTVLPRRHGGVSDTGVLFEIFDAAIQPPLTLVPDRAPHHVVAPAEPAALSAFQAALAATRAQWQVRP